MTDSRNIQKAREHEKPKHKKAESCEELKTRNCGPWLLRQFQGAVKPYRPRS
jgi:hypothetical protein